MQEIWKDVKGHEGRYQVSNYGNVKSLKRKVKSRLVKRVVKEIILKHQKDSCGYLMVGLSKNGITKSKYIHKIVAETFLSNNFNKRTINHKDGIKTNNSVSNLEYATCKENINHGRDLGLPRKHRIIISNDMKNKVRQLRKEGMSGIKISNEMNISIGSIYKIK